MHRHIFKVLTVIIMTSFLLNCSNGNNVFRDADSQGGQGDEIGIDNPESGGTVTTISRPKNSGLLLVTNQSQNNFFSLNPGTENSGAELVSLFLDEEQSLNPRVLSIAIGPNDELVYLTENALNNCHVHYVSDNSEQCASEGSIELLSSFQFDEDGHVYYLQQSESSSLSQIVKWDSIAESKTILLEGNINKFLVHANGSFAYSITESGDTNLYKFSNDANLIISESISSFQFISPEKLVFYNTKNATTDMVNYLSDDFSIQKTITDVQIAHFALSESGDLYGNDSTSIFNFGNIEDEDQYFTSITTELELERVDFFTVANGLIIVGGATENKNVLFAKRISDNTIESPLVLDQQQTVIDISIEDDVIYYVTSLSADSDNTLGSINIQTLEANQILETSHEVINLESFETDYHLINPSFW